MAQANVSQFDNLYKKKCMDLWFIPRENAEGVINVKGVPSILELFRSIDPGKDEDSQPSR